MPTLLYSLVVFIVAFAIVSGIWFALGFKKAGKQPWLAFVPVYGTLALLKLIKRPWWWMLLLWIPIVNNVMLIVLFFEWLRLFGYSKKRYTAIALITCGLFLIYASYKGPYSGEKAGIKGRSTTAWIASVVFAVVAATIVHTYFMQPFIIPTSSLEKTLLVGDFLFVSKIHYGARIPITPLALPMVHDTIPIIKSRSYIKNWQLPYMRLPGFQKIKRNDIVVFNWPIDTVRAFWDKSKIHVDKPIDKKSNYVKRCVGLPGDSLAIKDGYVFINGVQNKLPERSKLQFTYLIKMRKGETLSEEYMYSRFDVTDKFYKMQDNVYVCPALTLEAAEILKKNPKVASVERYISKPGYDADIFPHFPEMPWNVDQYGPIYIPKAGAEIKLTMRNLPLYRRIIEVYEGHTVETEGLQIKIDGQLTDHYTFAQNYYWMMGDNRNRSEDSRFWGFTPEDHIVGKAVFIWMSVDWSHGFKIRWERLFTTVSGSGAPVSYFKYFIVALGLWIIGSYVYKRRKKAKA